MQMHLIKLILPKASVENKYNLELETQALKSTRMALRVLSI